jgi:hypothetical protein
MFEWLFAEESRFWILVAGCIVGFFLVGLAYFLELFWEMSISVVVGLVVAAQWGFFIATLAFAVAFVALFEWSGRKVRVRKRPSAAR